MSGPIGGADAPVVNVDTAIPDAPAYAPAIEAAPYKAGTVRELDPTYKGKVAKGRVVPLTTYHQTLRAVKESANSAAQRVGSAAVQGFLALPRTLEAGARALQLLGNCVVFFLQSLVAAGQAISGRRVDSGATATAKEIKALAARMATCVVSAVGSPFAALYNKQSGVESYQYKIGYSYTVQRSLVDLRAHCAAGQKEVLDNSPTEQARSDVAAMINEADAAAESSTTAEVRGAEGAYQKAMKAANTAEDKVLQARKLVKASDQAIADNTKGIADAQVAVARAKKAVDGQYRVGALNPFGKHKEQNAALAAERAVLAARTADLANAQAGKVAAEAILAKALKEFETTGVELAKATKAHAKQSGVITFRAETARA